MSLAFSGPTIDVGARVAVATGDNGSADQMPVQDLMLNYFFGPFHATYFLPIFPLAQGMGIFFLI